jgi:hypothetical protein
MQIFGVDIIKGSPRAKEKPKYALFILTDDGESEQVVSRSKLLRIIRDRKPDIVSIDSINEIFSSKRELIQFLKALPASIKLVQVAGKESLPALAKRYGLKIDLRRPGDEARACAYLASFGVGSEVSVFLDKTIITVSRNRSLGKGGWRQNKYRRKVHNEVRRVFNQIKEILDTNELEYTESMKKGYGGISKGVFVVNAAKEKVPVNSFKANDVQVRVEAVERDRIELIPLRKEKAYTIVGVDPGTTTAVAVLDLNGRLLGVKSKKNWSTGEVIDYITSFGKPVVVATDRKNPPEFVAKLKASFQAVLYAPKEDMSVEKKKSMVSGACGALNDHERDAVAAAMEAYNSYKNKLMNVEKRIPSGFDADEIKAGIIRGFPLKELISEKKEKVEKVEKRVLDEGAKKELQKKEERIRELEEENRVLRKIIQELESEVERLKSKIVSLSREEHIRVRRENYVRSLESEVSELRKALKQKDEEIATLKERLETVKRMKYLELSREWKAIKCLRKFTKDEIERVEREMGPIRGEIIYIEDVSGGGKTTAEMLIEREVKTVIAGNDMSHIPRQLLEDAKIPIIKKDDVEIEVGEGFAVVRWGRLHKLIEEKTRELKKKEVDKLEKILIEYKNQRVSEFDRV